MPISARGGGRWAHIIKNEKYKTSNNQIQLLKRNSKGFDNIVFEDGYVRLLTRRELELLQTVPEGYTDCVTYEQAFNLLGDGWTIEVIKHIFKNIEL
ncbi:hypothetical protein EZS27_029785 [termite gut metagenome]|uniref:DNA (cytosine-5-)-methyltransferase n=1 Tax=termite gut metagenome TaxID=433724 RepID=A0A5J4QGR8_9ZZZZ